MGYIVTNAVAILAATCAGLAIGALYAVLQGERSTSLGFIITAVLAEAWLASILAGAVILAPPQAGAWTMALGSAVIIWIGFVVPTLLVTTRFDGLSLRHGLVSIAHWLAVMLVQAAVLQAIGLVRPT